MTTTRPATRKITSAVAVLALVLGTMTATARPAQAQTYGTDSGAALLGIAALAAIAIALDGKSQKAKAAPVRHPHVPPRAHVTPAPRAPACVQTGRHGATVCGQPTVRPRAQVVRPAPPVRRAPVAKAPARKPQPHRPQHHGRR